MVSRFDKIAERVSKRGEFLEEVCVELERWTAASTQTERWLGEVNDAIEGANKLPAEEQQARIEQVLAHKEERRPDFEELIRMGKALVAKKDVTDTTHVRDKIKVSLLTK